MRYFLIAFVMIIFVILYVWQNIEVMKIKLEYSEALDKEKELIKRNDRLRFEIEKYKTMDLIEAYAERQGMRKITPRDFEIIVVRKDKKR
jgi:hypothetical protein